MKTAISLPNDTFERVSRRASALGMSRSEFFARAAERYLDDLDASSTTAQINVALSTTSGRDPSSTTAVNVGRHTVFNTAEEW